MAPENKSSSGMSIADLLKKPVQQTDDKKRSELWGTGLDKKTVGRAAKQLEKDSERETKLQPLATEQDFKSVIEIQLPKSLLGEGIQLDDTQTAALKGLIKQRYGCITGAAGTGKTTTTKALLHNILQTMDSPYIAFVAFTGRAVQQIKRALPREYHDHCDTIHGLLEYKPVGVEKVNDEGRIEIKKIFMPTRTETNPLDQNVIIIDESGMNSVDLWNKLFAACKPDTRIFMIGDINQLPPVTGRSVFGFALQKWPAYELTKVHRTEENAIIDNAWRILHGQSPQPVNGKVLMKQVSDNSITAFQQTLAIIQRLHENDTFNPLRDALIVPQNVGNIGQEQINERLCPYFNPPIKTENIVVNPRTIITAGYQHISFAVGDKVMVTQNDRERGLTNGMIGVIDSIRPNERFKGQAIGDMAAAQMSDDFDLELDSIDDALMDAEREMAAENKEDDPREKQASHTVTIMFQNRDEHESFSTAGAINSLKHAYAFTCHKSQGGEYPVVVILLHSANLVMLSREWLYTAWTRAQEKVILLYNPRGLQHALNSQWIKGKTLQEKAASFIALNDKALKGDAIQLPVLPDPQEI